MISEFKRMIEERRLTRITVDRELGMKLIKDFEDAMSLREEADYGLTFSEAGAVETVEAAEAFSKKAKEVLKI